MFSTFTGNSRRPRNVNLSGQAANPFSNTSWSPSVASNATKTVTDAQAEREKRQAERQRLKAASNIQKAWRGYQSRASLKELRRSEFDDIYRSISDDDVGRRLSGASNLILIFFSPRRNDDLQRLFLFVSDCNNTNLQRLNLFNGRIPRLQRFNKILVQALEVWPLEGNTAHPLQQILVLITRLISYVPESISVLINEYYAVLANFSQTREGREWAEILAEALSAPLSVGGETYAYDALAFRFLTSPNLTLFEQNINQLGGAINIEKVVAKIVRGYISGSVNQRSNDDLLWLLAHFIDLGQAQLDSVQNSVYLSGLFIQSSALSSEISIRSSTQESTDQHDDVSEVVIAQPLPPYVSQKLVSLVDSEGIVKLLNGFSASLAQSSNQEFHDTGLLAGYILTLLHSFPGRADDVRLQLLLKEIPTTTSPIPILKFLWQVMHQTSIFQKLKTEQEKPVNVLRRYLTSASSLYDITIEEQEWRIILLFLELYIFILRLSDDEEFFSGIDPRSLTNNSSAFVLRASSLSLSEVEALTTFLKNTAFTLHYKVQEITTYPESIDAATKSRLDAYWNLEKTGSHSATSNGTSAGSSSLTTPTKLNLESLRSLITAALKMIYERDSRKHFLPADHWLMTSKLEKEDFISAVIVEEKQNQEQAEETDDEDEPMTEAPPRGRSGISTFASQRRLDHNLRIERLRTAQRRAQRERRLAELGPKLEILKHIPFVVPFETRVLIFRQFIHLDRGRRETNSTFPSSPFARHHGKIRRGNLFEDAFKEFYYLGEGLKDPIQITFVDQFDTPEAGIDGGGVTKEFLTSVTSEAFGNENGLNMFTSNQEGLLYPNPISADALRESLRQRGFNDKDPEWSDSVTNLTKRFEFLGRIVGKCMYEGILVDLAFAGFFLLKWPSPSPKEENNYKGSINDLKDMDEELYKGLLRLKNYPGDVSELDLDFTITDQVSMPGEQPVKTVVKDLVKGGDKMAVTNDKRLLYISYTARHRLVTQPLLQTTAFLRGLRDIIRPSWLSMFNQSELQRLVGGDSTEIDIDDLRRNTVYSGLYAIGDDNEEHPTIKMFWKVMASFTDAQRRDVLKYVSSTPRAPLLGFSQLNPKFSIRDSGSDEDRLPSTSTCVNLLKLPVYKRESTLRKKLLYAVTSGAGFDLS